MKTYISPIVKCINLGAETVILAGSNPTIDTGGGTIGKGDELTREQSSSSLWDSWNE